jgi:hypothetical protein
LAPEAESLAARAVIWVIAASQNLWSEQFIPENRAQFRNALTGWQEPGVLNRRRGLLNDKAAGRARSYRVGNRSGRINAFPRDLMRISIQGLLGCAKGAAAQLDPDPARHGRDRRPLRDEPKLHDLRGLHLVALRPTRADRSSPCNGPVTATPDGGPVDHRFLL